MPIDRPNPNTPRPLKPTLASNRIAKTPIAPRLAVAPTTAPTTQSQEGRIARGSHTTTPRANAGPHGESTPVKAFLNSNVTPRSSSRKSRVGVDSNCSTPSGTPSATPTTSRPTFTVDFPQRDHEIPYGGLASAGNGGVQSGVRPRSTYTSPTPRQPHSTTSNHGLGENTIGRGASPMFFHANDARPQEPPIPAQGKKAPVFFYANGHQDGTRRSTDVPSPPLSSVGKLHPDTRFFHADLAAETRDRPPILTPPPTSASPDPLPKPTMPQTLSPRPESPTKEWAHLSYRKGASQVITRPQLQSRNSVMSILSGPKTPELTDTSRRRSSAASALRLGHSKSASVSSIDSVADLKRITSNDGLIVAPSPLQTENRVVSSASVPESMASAPSPNMVTFSGLPSPIAQSPTKPANEKTPLEMMNELAANARRERKVLDLEISNSSLLAINRSLEREVRKQKAELRRFRRMSRAGRFSVDTVGSVDDFSVAESTTIEDLSDMSEEEAEIPEEEDVESSDSSLDDGTLSPDAQAERGEAHRLRDEKRLRLDLSKHRELLIDSQKMNQSLKRCMNWTEQLIKDGQKALQYKVHVSDVKLGGRVLVTEDDENDTTETEESRGLLSPWSPLQTTMDALESPFFPTINEPDHPLDRDSGVDLDGLPARPSEISGAPVVLDTPFEERIKHLQASIEALEAS